LPLATGSYVSSEHRTNTMHGNCLLSYTSFWSARKKLQKCLISIVTPVHV